MVSLPQNLCAVTGDITSAERRTGAPRLEQDDVTRRQLYVRDTTVTHASAPSDFEHWAL